MLDVKDPSNFAVTFSLGSTGPVNASSSPILVGIGPMGTNLAEDWFTYSPSVNAYPPVVKRGVFFGFTYERGWLMAGDTTRKKSKTLWQQVSSIRVTYNRDVEVSRLSFHVVLQGETSVWETT